jgi:hypothetical protein
MVGGSLWVRRLLPPLKLVAIDIAESGVKTPKIKIKNKKSLPFILRYYHLFYSDIIHVYSDRWE